MNIEQKVIDLIEEKISDRDDLFIVSVKMHPNGKLIIQMDGDEGIGIDDCVAISRFVGFKLEEEDVIEHAYNLEVSSPGIDSPLVLRRQYVKNIGRKVAISQEGKVREGVLKEVSSEGVLIEEIIKEKGKKAVTTDSFIAFDQITEIKVLISFK